MVNFNLKKFVKNHFLHVFIITYKEIKVHEKTILEKIYRAYKLKNGHSRSAFTKTLKYYFDIISLYLFLNIINTVFLTITLIIMHLKWNFAMKTKQNYFIKTKH
ncbi:hypothetical protein EDEG_02388 [Edhazardia aedis USNM 41457]|uniref:Uncharacterized protein n=1 Tax=Edhazardia aedis (strain USNM 41457) TaxID=1003232 RepID=J9DKV1_EDHAE|nr:hypothetical protein EDEG_02388 [Edhazardia aedis USNM 41457]|eukprot:EJW03220.1 hypothetical protein EDEG_02388 [Edhazardia aedis USNM 41457]